MGRPLLIVTLFLTALPSVAQAAPSWGTPISVAPPFAEQIDDHRSLASVSCPTISFCAATDTAGRAVLFDGAQWWTPVIVDRDLTYTTVSCPTPAFCAAVSSSGALVTYAEPSPTATPTPSAIRLAPPTPVLRSVKTGKRAVVAVVACTGSLRGACNVRLTLTAGKRTVGTAKVSLSGGTRRTVTVKLNAAGRRLLLKERLKVQLRVATAQRTVATRNLTLRMASRKVG